MGRTLRMDSAAGSQIDNYQSDEISPFETASLHSIESQYARWTEERNAPTPRYNCHGLTFASRRTAVDDPSAVQQILEEDGYAEVPRNERLPGIPLKVGDSRHC